MDSRNQLFKEKLESQHQFPGHYIFKFVVPQQKKEQLLSLLPEGKISFRESSGKTYVSVTLDAFAQSSSEIIEVYERAAQIEGVIAL